MSVDLQRLQEILPTYEIGGVIGRGGFGIVLEGRHRQLRREVAIKQLPEGFAAEPDVRARFLVEARLLASLDHPHIVPVHDFVEHEGMCLLVMDKLSGGNTWSRFKRSGLMQETTCAIGMAAASALHHAHGRGVLHRDVKPENLLFSAQGVMKVGDFGIAKVLDGGMTMATRQGQVLGTPSYMAPEQAMGEPVGPATDLYALGVTIYEFLSGALPFPREPGISPVAILYQRINEDPVPLAVAAPDVPGPISEVVMKALSRSPDARYESVKDFGVALAEAAGAAFGRGWLERSETTLMVGGEMAAATERHAGEATTGSRTVVIPVERGTHHTPEQSMPPPRDKLVEIFELPPPEEALSARASLDQLQAIRRQTPSEEADRAAAEVERIHAGAHEVAELGLLKRHRSGEVNFRREEAEEVERLLGATGTSPASRLGLPIESTTEELQAAAHAAIEHWRRRAESPLTPLGVSDASRTLVRTCEGILARLEG